MKILTRLVIGLKCKSWKDIQSLYAELGEMWTLEDVKSKGKEFSKAIMQSFPKSPFYPHCDLEFNEHWKEDEIESIIFGIDIAQDMYTCDQLKLYTDMLKEVLTRREIFIFAYPILKEYPIADISDIKKYYIE